MTKETLDKVQASNHKLACIPADTKVTEYWLSQLDNPNVRFVEFFPLAGSYEGLSYAAFEVPESMTKDEFHAAISRECYSCILRKTGVEPW